jgi:EAL domain-containing protein (putative c-di-GMP-specific phosphodiesterase class I)
VSDPRPPQDPERHAATLAPSARDVAVIGADGELEAVGEGWAQAIGRSRESLHGRRLAVVLQSRDAQVVADAVGGLLAGETPGPLEVHLRHVAGHSVRRLLQLTRVDDDEGRPLCITATLRPAKLAPTEHSAAVLDAWETRRVLLLAQPVVDLGSRRSVRHELLLRLLTLQGDVLVPSEVLPVLLEHGRGGELDRWVVDAAVDLLAGGGDRPPGVIEINLSAAAIGAPETIASHIRRRLEDAAIGPSRLVCGLDLEDVARAPDGAALLAATLQQVGCRVSLDRAEATPRTLALLHQVPYDILRLDGRLVHASSRDPAKLLLLRALLRAVARDGTEPVASEVQDDFDIALLRRNGVDHGQGFYLAEPADPADLLGLR